MKKTILMIVILAGYLFSQSWNNIATTTISEPNLVKLENLTNKDGIHIVVQNSNSTNSIKYYKLNSAGTVQTAATIESQGGAQYPSIAGDNDHLYISYRLSNNVLTKKYNYSTNVWDAQSTIPLNNTDCTAIDNVYNDAGLHLVYSESSETSGIETHYYLYSGSTPINHKVVSDQNYDQGQYPTVTVSANKVHVGLNSFGEAKSRDKNLTTNTWENTQSVSNSGSWYERIFAGYNKLFNFFHIPNEGIVITLKVKERSFTDASWAATSVQLNYSVNPYQEGMVSAANTIDQKTHIIYDDEQMVQRTYNVSTGLWSDEYIIPNTGLTQSFSLSAVSNDLFLVYKDYPGGSNFLKYIQFDAAPLAVQNYDISIYQSGNNKYPRLSWSLNNEPDVRNNNSAYKIERRTRQLLGQWSSWSVLANLSGTTSVYTDYTITDAGSGDKEAEYRITAVDLGSNSSSSQTITIIYGQGYAEKIGVNGSVIAREFSLNQNYPNPFNPSTKISYSIKEEGLVALKIYNILGKEVATLINENKPAGLYEVEFNAFNLPSGMYVYKLQAGNFTDVKKMLLTK